MGAYLAYDLDDIFSMSAPPEKNTPMDIVDREIPADTFLRKKAYLDFLTYKRLTDSINNQIITKGEVSDDLIHKMISSDSDYFNAYMTAGDYYFYREDYEKARLNFKM